MYLFEKFQNLFDRNFFQHLWTQTKDYSSNLMNGIIVKPKNEQISISETYEDQKLIDGEIDLLNEDQVLQEIGISSEEIKYEITKMERMNETVGDMHRKCFKVFPNVQSGLSINYSRLISPYLQV